MALARDFKTTVRERAERDPVFRMGMLRGALEALDMGEASDARALLRAFINATIGFQRLGEAIDRDPKSLMRALGPKGNPRLDLLSAVLAELARSEGFEVHVDAKPARRRRNTPTRQKVRAAA